MSVQQNAGELVLRVVELESELKRFKRTAFFAFAVLLVGGLFPAALLTLQQPLLSPGTALGRPRPWVQAKDLTFTDAQGRPRAALLVESGLPGLYLYNEEGQATLRVTEIGVQVLDDEGHTRGSFGHLGQSIGLELGPAEGKASLALHPEGPGLILEDGKARYRAALTLIEGVPNFSMADSSGQERLGLAAAEAGAHVRLSDGSDHLRTMLRVGSQGGAALDFYENSGELLISLGMNLADEPVLELPPTTHSAPPN